ncbi:MAG: hypothetical protein WCG06_00510, partial [Candidatus Omnitrophota bacterium]
VGKGVWVVDGPYTGPVVSEEANLELRFGGSLLQNAWKLRVAVDDFIAIYFDKPGKVFGDVDRFKLRSGLFDLVVWFYGIDGVTEDRFEPGAVILIKKLPDEPGIRRVTFRTQDEAKRLAARPNAADHSAGARLAKIEKQEVKSKAQDLSSPKDRVTGFLFGVSTAFASTKLDGSRLALEDKETKNLYVFDLKLQDGHLVAVSEQLTIDLDARELKNRRSQGLDLATGDGILAAGPAAGQPHLRSSGLRQTARSWGAPSDVTRREDSALNLQDLRIMTDSVTDKVHDALNSIPQGILDLNSPIIIELNLDFVPQNTLDLYINNLLGVINNLKDKEHFRNVFFTVSGKFSQRILSAAAAIEGVSEEELNQAAGGVGGGRHKMRSAEGREQFWGSADDRTRRKDDIDHGLTRRLDSVLLNQIPDSLKGIAKLVRICPLNNSKTGALNLPVATLSETDLLWMSPILELAAYTGRIPLNNIPDGYQRAYSILSGQTPDTLTLSQILRATATLKILETYCLKPLTKLPINQILQFFRLAQKQLEQAA